VKVVFSLFPFVVPVSFPHGCSLFFLVREERFLFEADAICCSCAVYYIAGLVARIQPPSKSPRGGGHKVGLGRALRPRLVSL